MLSVRSGCNVSVKKHTIIEIGEAANFFATTDTCQCM